MTSITFSSARVSSAIASETKTVRPSILSRLSQAIMESRERKAGIEFRRMQAAIGEPKSQLDYAMLPFAGE